MASLRRALLRFHETLMSPVLQGKTIPKPPMHARCLHGSFSRCTSDKGSTDIDFSCEESKTRLRNRLLYRSRQRGLLELDLILGKWVEDHIQTLDEERTRALADVLNLENPDLWKWITGQERPPEALNNNPVFSALHSQVTRNLNTYVASETRAKPGQPWVSGWDDKRGKDGPPYGNQ